MSNLTVNVNVNLTRFYDVFEVLEKCCEIQRFEDGDGMHCQRMVPTGKCDVGDYGRGFLCLSTTMRKCVGNEPTGMRVGFSIWSVDDSGAHGYTFLNEEKAKQLFEDLSTLIENMRSVPFVDELNTTLTPMGMFIEAY